MSYASDKAWYTVLAFVMASLTWTCSTSKELTLAPPSHLVGTVLVIGNEPFTELSVQTEDHKTFVIRKDTSDVYRKAWGLQGQKLRIRFRRASASDSTHIVLEAVDRVGEEHQMR